MTYLWIRWDPNKGDVQRADSCMYTQSCFQDFRSPGVVTHICCPSSRDGDEEMAEVTSLSKHDGGCAVAVWSDNVNTSIQT